MYIKKEKGITLIALVITIIVLLILAGIAIAALSGENGILTRASEAKTETRGASVQEARDLWKINQETDKHIENETAQTLEAVLNDLESQKLITPEERATIEETGQVKIGSRTIVFKENITDYVKVGHYVAYDPTVSDKNRTQQVESNKLTYISPTGSAKEHGNGYTSTEEGGGQKFTATNSTKWKVLDIGMGTVTLVSEKPIKKNETTQDSGNFVMKGAIGYLYAEQELNEICKIFGYGYGADTSQITKYSYGGPGDGELTGKITGSGARSITIEDVNKKTGIMEADYTTLNSDYGNTTNPTSDIYYPTINGDSITGISGVPYVKNLKYTYYSYDCSKIENTDVRKMLFFNDYWLASNCVSTDSSRANYRVRYATSDRMDAYSLCVGLSIFMNEDQNSSFAIRPVVTIRSDIIDLSTNYSIEGEWKLK